MYLAVEKAVQRFSFGTGQFDTVGALPAVMMPIGGLPISADTRYLMWARTDRSEADLMMIDNFR